MTITAIQAQTIVQDSVTALRTGEPQKAQALLEQLSDAGGGIDPQWLLLAQACRMAGDNMGEEAALSKLLAADKRHLAGLLLMGDLKARTDDDRAAHSFYTAAINMVNAGARPPETLKPMLQKARDFVQSAGGRFGEFLLQKLSDSGLDESSTPRGVKHSLDLLLGKREIFYQQPSTFYYPGLPQREFYERDEFDWLTQVEAAIPDMQEELAAVNANTDAYSPYVVSTPGRPDPNNPLLDDSSWGAFYFWQAGKKIADNIEQCPKTVAALEAAPIPVIRERSPMALYSVLEANTHIQPHVGMLNTRLICHIPLIIPPECALRVGSETRAWKEGEALIFDDSFEHEAWNRSAERRVILLFEIWRPEIGVAERTALTTIFEAISEYQKPVEFN